MTSLTAQALYDLYHPRLSKLGAWPDDLEFTDKLNDGYFLRDGPESLDYFPENLAACILRCAAEDVLCVTPGYENGIHLGKYGADPDGKGMKWVVDVEGRRMRPATHHEDFCIHHALCAALDTIIKEKECPPSNT